MHVPGSPFKLLVALTALQENAITPKTNIICSGKYIYGKNKRVMQCHCGGGFRNLDSGISYSCNSYFAMAFRTTVEKYSDASESMDIWSSHIKSFGLGNFLGNDLSVGKKGNIPPCPPPSHKCHHHSMNPTPPHHHTMRPTPCSHAC